MRIINTRNRKAAAENCRVADTFISRFKGLMGVAGLQTGSGLLIVPCNSIHMFFMKIPLDIVFLDRDNHVVYTVEGIMPWKLSKIVRNSYCVLELPVGTIESSDIRIDDMLELTD